MTSETLDKKLDCLYKCYKSEWEIVFKSLKCINKKRTFFWIFLFSVFIIPYFCIHHFLSFLLLILAIIPFYFLSKEIEKSILKNYELTNLENFSNMYRGNFEGIRFILFKECLYQKISKEDIYFIRRYLEEWLKSKEKSEKKEFERKSLYLIAVFIGSFWSKLEVSRILGDYQLAVFVVITVLTLAVGFMIIALRYSIRSESEKIKEILTFLSLYELELSFQQGDEENVPENKDKKH